jgi:inorganic pyrophosphatase
LSERRVTFSIAPPSTLIEVVIESPRFSHIKRKANGHIDFISPLPCPFNYGCVPELLSGDGDPIDAVVLGARLPRGTKVTTRVIAVVDFIDAGDIDPKWICSDAPMTPTQHFSVHTFFVVYAIAKRQLNRVRGLPGATLYRGINLLA